MVSKLPMANGSRCGSGTCSRCSGSSGAGEVRRRSHPEATDPYWGGADLGAVAERLAVPVALVSGWHDVTLDQTLRQYRRLRRAGTEASLLIGPWTHNSALQQGWPEVFAEALAWLRAHLGEDRSGLRAAPVRVHVGGSGSGEWRELPDWPAAPAGQRWYPGADGTLATGPGASEGVLTVRNDPADPTPSVGGQTLSPKGGSRDNRALEAREDVLVFSSAPLAAPLELIGAVSAELRVSAATPSADVFVRLCDVDPRGRSVNICDGLLRLSPEGAEPVSLTVPMSATAHRLAAGHRIRLQISAGAHPRYARNTGTAGNQATAARAVPVELTVHLPAAVVLPVAAAG
ncbi:CocE/NonD family hydrolase [Kitasatospora sp. NPDC002227]|uniref:CocE/NonD family hydrolase n=1 Tax=Kitasatospora sp. NPDC002227 TaxID=3154773 RepID=UPI003333E7E4